MPVLESIVAGVLNTYLGKYVEDLESRNLDVGILSGSLELLDLDVKPEALYELNLPVEVKAGHIGRIHIDVSWTSLFSQPLVVDIEDVFILVNPTADGPYDAVKEQRLKNAIKQKALEELERPRKKKTKSQIEEEESLSFSERLTASIINNVQIRVSNVHVRYEDSTTHPGKPFAFGFTLQRFAAESTDERWQPIQIDCEATILRKLADMTAMCVYWNPHIHQLVGRYTSGNSWKDLMKDAITSLQVNGEEFDLIVHPITTMARLYYDKTSAPDYVSPQFVIDILTDTIAIGLSRQQYLCAVDLAESLKMMEVNERYRKYRPNVSLRGNAKQWWHYAMNAIIEEHIRPWSRERLMRHHQLYYRYLQKSKEKMVKVENKQDLSNVDKELKALEQKLDVTSIVIAREKAKLQFAKEAPERERKRREKREKEKSWFWSILGYDSETSSSEGESEEEEDIWSMLPEEEQSLISSSIGFSKQSIEELAHMPMEYVQNKISFQLSTCSVTLKNHSNKILQTSFQNVQMGFETRPAAGAIHLMMSTDSVVVQGCSPDREPVTVITSEKMRNDDVCQVFSLDFETNPLMVRADSALAITTEPIDVTYHEHSVSELISFLRVPNINLEGLKSAAYSQWQELTKVGHAGLVHAIENHKTIQVDIDVKSPNLIIPEYGSMDKKGHRLVIDLGSLRVNSDLQKGYTSLEDATPTEIEDRLYDRMIVRLDDIQVLLVDAGDDWNEALLLKESSFHLLPSMGVQLNLFNSVKPDYKELPQQKVEAVLPSLKFLMSDQKLQTILQFAKNLPLPDVKSVEEEIRPGPQRGIVFNLDKMHIKRDTTFNTLKRLKRAASRRRPPGVRKKPNNLQGVDAVDSGIPLQDDSPESPKTEEELYYSASDHSDETLQQWATESPVPCFDDNDSQTNKTSLLFRFIIREVVLIIDKLEKPTTPGSTNPLEDMALGAESPDNESINQEAEYLMLRIDSVCTDVAVSNFGIALQLGLKSINVIDKFHTGPDGAYLHLLSSAAKSELISILYRKVDRKCPDFIGYYSTMEQAVTVRFTALNMVFHRTAVLYLKNFLQELEESLQTSSLGRAVSMRSQKPVASISVDSSTSVQSQMSLESTSSRNTSTPSVPVLRGIVKFYLQARMDYLRISLVDVYENLADVYVRDLDFSISDRASRTNIRTRLRDFSVEDPLGTSLYSKLLCLQDQTAFDLKLVMFKKLPAMQQSRSKSLSCPSSPEGSVETNDSLIAHATPLNYDIRLRIGRVQAIWLTQTVKNFMAFFQPFVDQEVVESARVSTQNAVQKQVEDLTKQGARIGLNLNIRAPVIFVPQGPQSTHTLVANLGDLLIHNTLEEAEGSSGGRSLVDHISVQLYHVQVSRGIVSTSDQVLQAHRQLVEPVTLNVDIKRSLPPYGIDRVPLDISGTLANILINIGEQDMMTVLAVFNENLFAAPDFSNRDSTRSGMRTPPPSPAFTGVDAPEGIEADDFEPPAHWKDINISFEMEGVEIRLFSNEPKLSRNGTGLSKREPRYGLSRFQLQEVATIISVYKDETLELSSSIQTITLDDIRPNSPLAIRKLLLKSEKHYHTKKTPAEKSAQSKIAGLSEDKGPPMVEFTYTQSAKKNQQVTFTIEDVRVNIFVHYLLAIYNFLSSTQRRTRRLESPVSSTSSNTSRQNLRTIVVPGRGSIVEGPYYEQPSRGKVRITGEVRRPEVVLFDDPTSEDSQVLVFKMEGRMAYQADGTEESALANISDMQMFSCVYSQALKTAYQVLEPCAISCTRTVSLEGETMGIDVTDVKLHVSPRVVFVVNGVVDALNSVTQRQSNSRALIEDFDQEDMWTPKPIFSHGFHKRRGSMKNMVDFAPIPDPNASTQHLKVQLPRVQVLLEYEEGCEHVAMVCVRSGVQVKIADWSQAMRTEAEVTLEALMYNEKLSTWEPVLEPVMEKENVYRPWEILVKMVKAESRPIVCTSQLDTHPGGTKDSVDGGGVSIRRDPAYPASDSGTEEDSDGGDTELEWDGHYSSSYLSSDIGSPMDPDKKLLQNEPTSDEEDAADTEGLFDRVKDFFGDFFSESDSEDDEGEGHQQDGDEEATQQLLEGGRTDSGIASLARPASASLTSSESKDDTDSDLNFLEAESLATYMVINSRDRLEITATPYTLNTLKDLADAFTTKPKPQMNVILEESSPLLVVNMTGMKAKLTVLAEQVGTTATENVSLIPVGKPVIPGIDIPDSGSPRSSLCQVTMRGGCLNLDTLSTAVKASKYSNVPEIISPLKLTAQLANNAEDEVDASNKPPTEEDMVLEVEGFRPLDKFLSSRVGQTLYFLTPSKKTKDLTQYAVVKETNISHGRRSIKIRSPLQVTNHCSLPLQLFYKKLDLQSLQGATIPGEEIDEHTLLGVLKPNQTFDVPVVVAYNAGLYACPLGQQEFGVSEKPILWQELEEPIEGSYYCPSRKRGESPFHFKVLRKEHKIGGVPNSSKVPSYVLNIHPPITIHNFLPYDVVYSVKPMDYNLTHALFVSTMKPMDYNEQENGLKFLLKGDKMDVHSCDLSEKQNLKLQIKHYMSANWEGELPVSREMKAFESINMGTRDHLGDQKKYLTLWAHSSTDKGSWDIFLYSPYWVVNKSELPVEIRASRSRKIFNNQSHSEPILFSFASSKRKKAKLRVFDSVWSSSFSLDTVGSSGVVICKDEDHDRTYQFWLDIKMSKLSLTKIVTITPYFLVHNKTDMDLSYMEEGVRAGIWVNIRPNEVLSFWPGGNSMKLTVRRAETPDQLSSRHFSVDTPGTTVLRMEKGTALTVQVEGGVRSPTTITFMHYTTGHAPVRLDNLCDDINLRFNQKNVGGRLFVQPRKNLLYTWDDPTTNRQLHWNLYNRNKKSFECVIDRDGWGKMTISCESIKRSTLPGDGLYVEGDDASIYSTDDEDEPDAFMDHPLMNKKEKTTMYWVSYMDGLQRVLMFTQNPRVARQASQANISESANIEVFMSLEGAGISLVNAAYEEVAYFSIYCCPAKWEVETKPDKWKALNMELSAILEDRWKCGESQVSMENAVEADLSKHAISKPVCGTLRRSYTPSFWVHYRQSDHHMGLHVKIQKLQIDNQLYDAYFPTVLHVSPLPREVLKRSGPKPFIEMSMLRRQVPENDVDTIKYCKVLIQEASVKIDNGFLLSVLEVMSGLQEEQEEVLSLKSDLAMVKRSLKEMSISMTGYRSPIYFEYFHLSPLKLIVSLSLSGEPHIQDEQSHSFKNDAAKFFVESIGSTLTEVTEVELKLAYFERTNTLMTMQQLVEEAKGHYISQGIKQAYVFILGLEVLGNPYGLFRDVKEGISDFFYEPYLGAIQGPGEFAEGLARGVQSLLGHTVGGVADTFAGLSGTLGRALAVLSFDEDYQKRRQMYIQVHPDSFPRTLLHAGQGFVMGIVIGLSGIVVSPVRGARDEGIKGFFKGIGKGLLGIIAKPTGGIFDSITLILEGIGRAAETGEEIVVRVRIPRFIDPKVGVSPYSPYLSVGNCMLHHIRRREFHETDVYFIHAVISDDSTPDVALITNRQVMVIEKCRWYGGWDLKHADILERIKGTPILDGGKIVYHIKDNGKMIAREIDCHDEELSQWLFDKLTLATYLPPEESTPGAFVTADSLHGLHKQNSQYC